MKHLSSSEKYITEELTPIDLEILLSESRVESESTLIAIDVKMKNSLQLEIFMTLKINLKEIFKKVVDLS